MTYDGPDRRQDSMIDWKARQVIAVTKQRLEDHEKQCGERWDDAKHQLGLLFKHSRASLITVIGVLISVVGGMGTIITMLLANGFNPD